MAGGHATGQLDLYPFDRVPNGVLKFPFSAPRTPSLPASGGSVECKDAVVPARMERKQEEDAVEVVTLRAVEATPESFAPFGQVVSAGSDGAKFGPDDAQLDLSRGIPR